MTDGETHTPLDALLGSTPRRVMRHWLSLLLLGLAALTALVFFVRFVTGDDSPYYSTPIERGDLIPLLSERGQIRGAGEVTVTASSAGRITWVVNKSDGLVKNGELLARIEAGELRRTIEIEKARLTSAQAALDGAQVDAQARNSRLARFESVWRRSGGRAPSYNELETARADAKRAELAVDAARAEVQAARLQLKEGQTGLSGAEVRAPIDGVLVTRHAQAGQAIATGQPLFTLAAGVAPLTIEAPLPAQPLQPIKAGSLARVRLDAMPDKPQSATLSLLRIAPAPGTAPSRAVFTLEQPDPAVRPGMAATVEIELPARRNVLLVPDAALAFDPAASTGRKRSRIYLLSDDGEPRRVYVTTGGSDGKRTEVFAEGIEPGNQVIIGWRAPALDAPARPAAAASPPTR